ncbi:MAG: hypothetical protein RLY19_803 [Actinomycetota bacterium]|jgi:hypothetical protein
MIPVFENNLANWKVHVTFSELIDIKFAAMALNRRSPDPLVIWLTKTSGNTRLWVVRHRMVLSWVTSEAEASDPDFALPIPESFLNQLVDLSAGTGADLTYNEAEGVIIARSGDQYLAVDHPVGVEFEKLDLPYLDDPFGTHQSPVVATVKTADLEAFVNATQTYPRSIVHPELNVWPFISIAIGDGTFAWTSDWRRFGYQRTTGSVSAVTNGSVSASFYPYPLAAILQTYVGGEDVRIFIDGPDAQYAYFVGEKWGVRVVIDAEHLARWSSVLEGKLEEAGCAVRKKRGERIPDFLQFNVDDAECFASIHEVNDGLSELLCLTYIASSNTPETLGVLTEINRLNASLQGVRVSLRGEEVHVSVDFLASTIDSFSTHFARFRVGIAASKSLQTFLPLFAG